MHAHTKVEEVQETNWTLRFVELESRHNINISFVVRVPTHHLEAFPEEVLWPEGVNLRRFLERLRDTSYRNTTPTLHVQ